MVTEGFWLNLYSGESILVRDHANAVRDDPKRFSVPPDAIAGLSPHRQEDYDTLRMLAIQRGWARVRTHGSSVTVEFSFSPIADVILLVVACLQKNGFGEYTWVNLHDLKNRKEYGAALRDLADPEKSLEAVAFADSLCRKVSDLCERAEKLAGPAPVSVREEAARFYKK